MVQLVKMQSRRGAVHRSRGQHCHSDGEDQQRRCSCLKYHDTRITGLVTIRKHSLYSPHLNVPGNDAGPSVYCPARNDELT